MENKRYSSGWKHICLVVQLILTVIFVVSVFMLTALHSKHILDGTNLGSAAYQDSGCYSKLFEKKTDELVQFLKLRDKFEDHGVYNPDKIINTMGYSQNGTLRATSNGTHVVVVTQDSEGNFQVEAQDDVALVEGSSSDEASDAAEDAKQTAEEQQKQEEQKQKKEDKKKLLNLSNYRLSDLISWSKTGCDKQTGVLVESYLPIGQKSIADSLKDGDITKKQADSLYLALEQTLSAIGDEETSYKKGLNTFQSEETNLSYTYSENGSLLYSNVTLSEDALAYARAKGSYMYYNDKELKFRTNVNGMESYFYNTLDPLLSGMGNHAELMVAVDTTFPYQDSFTDGEKEYSTLRPWVMISVAELVISVFGWIITLVYLTNNAGRGEKEGVVVLSVIDHIKTEIFFGIFVLITLALIGISFSASRSSWDIPGMLVLTGATAFVYDLAFLGFYLSMVRRVKAGVLWEYSLLNWIIKSTKRVLHTWKSSIRVIFLFVLNVIMFLALGYWTFSAKSMVAAWMLILMILLEGALYLRNIVQHQEIMKGIEKITDGNLSYKLPLENLHGDNCELAEAVNSIGDGLRHAVDESTKNERMKADLITNVSHDIKTPLTSIINYVNLLKMERIEDKRIAEYIDILDEKSQRLKQLTEDLVEASRISSGNITLHMTRINLVELIYQTGGEFNEKFEAKDLTTITKLPKEAAYIMADGRRIWRVVENLYNNVAKYAMAHTRVYVTMEKGEDEVSFEIKNVSEQALNVESTDLTERFVRGDESRTTEGSGLGLSIARNLTNLMGGTFRIDLDGDVFTARFTFPLAEQEEAPAS